MAISERPEVLAALESAEAQLAELCGQRNALVARMAAVIARVDAEELWQSAGARSVEHWVAWKCGVSHSHAADLVAVARRRDDLPECFARLDQGLISEDQLALIARRAPAGADARFAELAPLATVSQLRTALRLTERAQPDPMPEPAPAPVPTPEPDGSADDRAPDLPPEPAAPAPSVQPRVSAWFDDEGGWQLRAHLPVEDGAYVDQALRAELDGLVQEWKRARKAAADAGEDEIAPPPFPTLADALVRLAQRGLDGCAAERPHAARTTVVLHVDVEGKVADLHVGPALTEAERRYLCCDATFETWFERDGELIGAARTTRKIPRRLRRALERRAGGICEVPGCHATHGLQAHHIWHWEDGGPTELWNLLLVCPHHHRLHHRGIITIRGPANRLRVLDRYGRLLTAGSLARSPQQPPPAAPRYRHPSGERADWRWFDPPRPPPSPN